MSLDAHIAGVAGMSVAIAVVAGCGDGAGISVTLSSRLTFGFDIVHDPAQHGIACIDSVLPAFPTQHAVAAGNAVTNRTAMASMNASRFVADVVERCTMSPTRSGSIDISRSRPVWERAHGRVMVVTGPECSAPLASEPLDETLWKSPEEGRTHDHPLGDGPAMTIVVSTISRTLLRFSSALHCV